MSAIQRMKNQLTARKGHCTREANKVRAEINVSEINCRTLLSAIQRLESKHSSYQGTYDDLDIALLNAEDPSRETVTSTFVTYDIEISSLISQAYKAHDDRETHDLKAKQALHGAKSATFNQIKLPNVEPIKFNGELDKWTTFWSNFEALVHNNASLSPCLKFTHLQRCLTGEAYEVVRHFPCDDASYAIAVKRLQDEYDNPQALEEKLIDKFIDLDSAKYTVASLNSFVNTYESILASIRTKQPNFMNAECLIKRMIGRKLPKEVRTYLELKTKQIYFSLSEITAGIHDCIQKLRANEEDENPGSLSFEEKIVHPVLLNSKRKVTPEETTNVVNPKSKGHLPQKAKPVYVNNRSEAIVNSTTRYVVPKNATNQEQRFPCLFCSNTTHYSSQCPQYTTIKTRLDRLTALSRCQHCAKKGHMKADCVVQLRDCKRCSVPHHSALCPKMLAPKENPNPNTMTAAQSSFSIKSCIESCSVALPTATAKLSSGNNCLTERVFFDQGSQCSIISTNLAQKLDLKPVRRQKIAVSGLLADSELTEYDIVKVFVTIGRRQCNMTTVVMDRAVASINIPGLSATHHMLKQKKLKLADHRIDQDLLTDIGLTIGADYYGEFVKGGVEKRYGTYLARTPGGYMIFGPLKYKQLLSAATVTSNRVTSNLIQLPIPPLQEAIEPMKDVPKLWELDTIGINPKASKPEDDLTYEKYLESVQYNNNQYWVRLPWKPDYPHLATNFRMATGQVQSLRNNLHAKGNLDIYDELIRTQLHADFIELVSNATPIEGETHYLPHHAVKKDSVTTPIRIVFNCSAKSGTSPSLNECLLTGPTLTSKLGDALLEFRTQKYAVVGDISKAFLRIGLQTCDRDFTRFLWFSDPHDPSSPLITYRFKAVLFGATCSPFLLEATLESHVKKSSSPYKDRLRRGFYVDNLQTTTSSIKELHSIYEDANILMAQANMPLRMWVTNEQSLTTRIQNDFPDEIKSSETNVLGILWKQSNDTVIVKSPKFAKRDHLSKRQLLSNISATFDPLGLVSPITIRGKMLMKEAWKLKTDWDSPLPRSIVTDWEEIQLNLHRVDDIEFPRSVVNDQDCSLHVFCDASQHAYGACAYIVSYEHSHLLTSKGRVTPVKTRSLPELELTAIQIGTQLAHYINQSLPDVKITNTFIWSDNEPALQWVRNDKSDTPYVKNRTAKIRDLSCGYTFLHVGTKDNPADLISRGTDVDPILNSPIWFHGPSWLLNQMLWPPQKPTIVCVHAVTLQPHEYLFDCSRFNSLNKILGITEKVLKFVESLLKRKCKFKDGSHYWLYATQEEKFFEELQTLKHGKLPKKLSLIHALGLYIDPTDQLLHCRGRIKYSNSTTAKFPILLSRHHHFSKCLVAKFHSRVMHGGTGDTLARLRENYWLPKGRQVVKQVLSKCYTCRYLSSKTYHYPGPPVLPECRVKLTVPFATVGVDYSGSINVVSLGQEVSKFYFCIFTCATTRAIHLELARDMTAETFLHLLRRFIARRSCPSLMISDNGKYFTANANFIRSLQENPIVKEFLQERKIEWKFIPPRSPWMGGFYERLVGVVKRALRLVLFRRHVTENELHTLLTEVEQRVNNRPLTYIDDDIDSPIPLTPAHLLYGRRLESFPSVITYDKEDPTFAEHNELNLQYNRLNKILVHWEKVWSKEYIASLREKFYGASQAQQTYSPSVGDVVIIVSEGNRAKWPLGRITKLHPDESGIVRVVEVFTRGNNLIKTLNQLVPLESALYQNSEDMESARQISETTVTEESDEPQEEVISLAMSPLIPKPRRRAAIKAETHRQQLLANDQL